MGRVIEFYTVPDAPPQYAAAGGDLPAGARLVGAPSINSAAFGPVCDWLAATPLNALAETDDEVGAAIHVAAGELAAFAQAFPVAGPPGTESILAAVEDAVDEARWYRRGLWIRMP